MILGSLAALPLFGGRVSDSYTIGAEGLLPQTSYAAGGYILNGTMANFSGSSAGGYTLLTGVNPPSNTLISLPSILEQPVGASVLEGGDLSLSVIAGGPGPYGYQWFKGNDAIIDAINNQLVVLGVTGDDGGGYSVVVSNPFGEVESQTATASVTLKPRITSGLTDKLVKKGGAFTFTLVYQSSVPVTFAWYKDGVLIEGATRNFYSKSNLGDGDFGTYMVEVTNVAGSTTSSAEVIRDGAGPGDVPPALVGSDLVSEEGDTKTWLSDWFGEFTVDVNDPLGWVYTKQLGWTYFTFVSTPESSYIYPILVEGILFTNNSLYPNFAWSYSDASWILLYEGNDASSGSIWAWVYSVGEWREYSNDQ